MELPRRTLLKFAGVAAAAPAFSKLVTAQTYPSRPITMIVPYAAGGINDTMARVVAERMRRALGQPVIIENVSGADGSLGTGRAARARPDGYTLGYGSLTTHVMNSALYSLNTNELNEFAPISPLGQSSFVLFARKAMPAKDLNELIAWLKANPNRASVGVVSVNVRLLAAFFQRETGTQFTLVPYRGGAPATQDLVAGQIDLYFGVPTELPLMRAGSIKAYAVTSDARWALAPDIPTFKEMGLPAVSYSGWSALFAPSGTPREIINKLNAAAVDALADTAVRSRLVEFGQEIFPRERQTPEALSALMKDGAEKWWPLIKELGIKAD